jgi:glutaredoxin
MFLARLFRRGRARPDLHFVLFTRQGCHLCDAARQLLVQAKARYRFQLEIKDVDAAPEWVAAYGACVPVVTVNGKVRFRGKVNEVLLQRLLDAPTSANDE